MEPDRFINFGVCEMQHVEPEKNCLRYYRIEVRPGLFDTVLARYWGRLGQKPRYKEEFFSATGDAMNLAQRLYRRKKHKGYVETGYWVI